MLFTELHSRRSFDAVYEPLLPVLVPNLQVQSPLVSRYVYVCQCCFMKELADLPAVSNKSHTVTFTVSWPVSHWNISKQFKSSFSSCLSRKPLNPYTTSMYQTMFALFHEGGGVHRTTCRNMSYAVTLHVDLPFNVQRIIEIFTSPCPCPPLGPWTLLDPFDLVVKCGP